MSEKINNEPRTEQDRVSEQGRCGELLRESRIAGIHRLTKYTLKYKNTVIVRYVAEQYQNGWTRVGCHFYEYPDGRLNVELFEKHLNAEGKKTEKYKVKVSVWRDETAYYLEAESVERDDFGLPETVFQTLLSKKEYSMLTS